MKRRSFLTIAVTSGLTAGCPAYLLAGPRQLIQPNIGIVNDWITATTGLNVVPYSEAIQIITPQIAENADVVPLSIGIKDMVCHRLWICLGAHKDPVIARYTFGHPVTTFATRIKAPYSETVVVVVDTDRGYFRQDKPIKVTRGCGGGF